MFNCVTKICFHIPPPLLTSLSSCLSPTQSLDDSVSSVSPAASSESVQKEVTTLKAELASRDESIALFEDQLLAWRKGKEILQQELISLKDRLNVSEVE